MKIKLLAAFLIWICVFRNNVFAQKEHYVWYFGSQAGLDFNSGSPVALTNGVMYQSEGCSSISDANGNFLFYTNGIRVWDRNHIQMPNGDSLEGGPSSTQSALIVPMPGNNQQYYIFTVQQVFSPPNNFSYSIVDMSLNLANGDVTIKNNIIKSAVTEKLTAVKHSNGSDIWIMVHGYGNDSLFAYLVTGSGVLTTPVVSKIGQIITLGSSDTGGYMKFSPDGAKLAFAAFGNNYVDLFDFNAATGLVTNEKYLSLPTANLGAYGLEFSRDGNYLYCAFCAPSHIFQWDITSNSDSIINSTLQQIGSSTILQLGALQMGPDGKIYVAKYQSTSFLGVINFPDSSGVSCNYVDSAVSLAGNICGFGLPNFLTSYFLTTGINTNNPQQNQLTISPNPATDKITISFPSIASENITIKIFSTTGEKIFSLQTANSLLPASIDVSNFTNGIYFISLQTGKEFITRKLIVNH